MSQAALAAEIGVHTAVIDNIEKYGWIDELTLRQVLALEDALGIEIVTEEVEKPNDLSAAFCAALAETDDGLTLDDLSAMFEVSPEVAVNIVRSARRSLRKLGLTLTTASGSVRLVPFPSKGRVDDLVRSPTMEDLDDDDLEILLDVAVATRRDGQCRNENFNLEDRDRLGRLVRIGVFDTAHGGVCGSNYVEASLAFLREELPYFRPDRLRPRARHELPA
jgi:hypothetical protein